LIYPTTTLPDLLDTDHGIRRMDLQDDKTVGGLFLLSLP